MPCNVRSVSSGSASSVKKSQNNSTRLCRKSNKNKGRRQPHSTGIAQLAIVEFMTVLSHQQDKLDVIEQRVEGVENGIKTFKDVEDLKGRV